VNMMMELKKLMMMSTIMATDGPGLEPRPLSRPAGWPRATSSGRKYGAYAPWDEDLENGNEVSP